MNLDSEYVQVSTLGKGTYGSVLGVQDKNKEVHALKIIPSRPTGCNCLMETVLMSSLEHPTLNSASNVLSDENNTYILSRKATCDMNALNSSSRRSYFFNIASGQQPSPERLAKWLFGLADAVSALHSLSVIHADIKPGNVLYYAETDDIKLTDFTLSVKTWPGREQVRKSACTNAYSPPEYLRNKEWDKSLDIWSLACTFYEIAYGSQLFPCQTFYPIEQKYYLKMSYYNAIVLWLRGTQQKHKFIAGVEYSPVNTCDDFKNPKNDDSKALRRLILSMLRYIPSERPSISDILNADYFQHWIAKLSLSNGKTVLDYLNYTLIDNATSALLYDFVVEALSYPISNLEFSCSKVSVDCFKFIYRLTLQFVSATFSAKISELKNVVPEQIYAACISLSCKIFFGGAISLNLQYNLSKIVETENIITTNLAYCLPIFFA